MIQRAVYVLQPPARRTARMFNALDYGAEGDGVTDDTPAVQAALDAAAEAGGGIARLPDGPTRITNTLTIRSGVTLEGSSATILKPAFSSAKNRVIQNDWSAGDSDITLRDFAIDRSGSDITHGVLLNGVTRLRVQGLRFINPSDVVSGCLAVSSIGPTTRLLSRDIRIEGCHFGDYQNFGVQLGYVDSAVVVGNTFEGGYREAIGVEPEDGTTARNVTIQGNAVQGGGTPNGTETGLIIVTETSGGTVIGVTVTGNALDGGELIENDTSPGVMVIGGTGIVVNGNTIQRACGPGVQVGIASSPTDNVLVVGNTILDCNAAGHEDHWGYGISLREATGTVVVGNVVNGASHVAAIGESSNATGTEAYANVAVGCPLTPA